MGGERYRASKIVAVADSFTVDASSVFLPPIETLFNRKEIVRVIDGNEYLPRDEILGCLTQVEPTSKPAQAVDSLFRYTLKSYKSILPDDGIKDPVYIGKGKFAKSFHSVKIMRGFFSFLEERMDSVPGFNLRFKVPGEISGFDSLVKEPSVKPGEIKSFNFLLETYPPVQHFFENKKYWIKKGKVDYTRLLDVYWLFEDSRNKNPKRHPPSVFCTKIGRIFDVWKEQASWELLPVEIPGNPYHFRTRFLSTEAVKNFLLFFENFRKKERTGPIYSLRLSKDVKVLPPEPLARKLGKRKIERTPGGSLLGKKTERSSKPINVDKVDYNKFSGKVKSEKPAVAPILDSVNKRTYWKLMGNDRVGFKNFTFASNLWNLLFDPDTEGHDEYRQNELEDRFKKKWKEVFKTDFPITIVNGGSEQFISKGNFLKALYFIDQLTNTKEGKNFLRLRETGEISFQKFET